MWFFPSSPMIAPPCYDGCMVTHRSIVGADALRHHFEDGARLGVPVSVEFIGNTLEGTLATTGTDIYVEGEGFSVLVYSHLFGTKVAWNFLSMTYLDDNDG